MVEAKRPAGMFDLEVKVKKYPRLEWLIPMLLCAILWGELLASSRQLSQTADEALHLYAGYRYLKCGDLIVSPEHPPLAKMIAAVPLLPMNFAVNCALFKDVPFVQVAEDQGFASLAWLYRQDWPTALARARAAISIFALGLCVLVWIVARRMFGFAAAIVAVLLLIFEPTVLSYGALVMTDIPVTCMLLLAVFGSYLWVKSHTAWSLLLTGVAAGLTLLTKASGVVVVPILCALAIADALTQPDSGWSRWRQALRNLLAVAIICVLAFGVLWVGYGLRFAKYPGGPAILEQRALTGSFGERAVYKLEDFRLLPQAYLEGFAAAMFLSKDGSSVTFAAGRVYEHAPWFATPFNLLVRSTGAMLAMLALAMLGWPAMFRWRRRESWFLLVPAAVYMLVCLHASPNVQIRYLLPLFPFLLIAVAAGCIALFERARWARYVLPCLIALHAASSLHAYPNYLSYANDLWGGPEQAYKYAPWVDIGQAYPQARAYLAEHPAQNCWFVTFWQWDPKMYGVPCQSSGLYLAHEMPSHVHGTVIVSSTLLTHMGIAEGEIAAAFKNATPKDRIGGSALLVYEGDFDTSLNAAAGESNLAMRAVAGDLPAAREHARKAAAVAPKSPLVHVVLCRLLESTEPGEALRECSIARDLLLADPLPQERSRVMYLKSVESSIQTLRASNRESDERGPARVRSTANPVR